jgi:hypothetical protein
LRHDAKGLVGKVVYLCNWSDVDPAPLGDLPKVGDSWSFDLPYLVCVQVEAREGSIGECEFVAHYSTDRQLAEEFYEASWDWDFEVIDCTRGYVWRDVGTPVDVDIPTVMPVASYRITMRRLAPPNDVIDSVMGKVNDRKFHGCAAGTLRFDGCGTDESYDLAGALLSVRTVYKFTKRQRPHNEAWREPLQARDENGELMYWSDVIDSELPNYTEDATKIATPYYVSGDAGTAGWDEPQDSLGDPRYGEADFATVLDIPVQAGDDAAGGS